MIQKYFKRDPSLNRDSNAFKNNVLLIDLSRGVSLKRSLRLVIVHCSIDIVITTRAHWKLTSDLKSHYSKSQMFVQKFNFEKNPIIFTSFSSNFFFDNFSREIKVVKS